MHSKTNVKINSMKCRKLSIVAVSVVLFCSCGQQPAQERGPRPVKLAEVASLNKIEKSYSGVVSPDQFSDLAFKMSGPLISLNVDEGQKVRTGQIVAEIDPLDFKWEYEAKKASFQTAEAQLQRAKKLLSKQAISKQEYESTEASYSNAKAAFEYAQNTLNQTKLRAPFDGFIQKKSARTISFSAEAPMDLFSLDVKRATLISELAVQEFFGTALRQFRCRQTHGPMWRLCEAKDRSLST